MQLLTEEENRALKDLVVGVLASFLILGILDSAYHFDWINWFMGVLFGIIYPRYIIYLNRKNVKK